MLLTQKTRSENLLVINQLHYRRQFLLARQVVLELDSWSLIQVGSYYLQVHPDLEITKANDINKSMIVLGYLFDPQNYQATNKDILEHLLASTTNFHELTSELKQYPGRYALFYKDGKCFYLIQDALSLREVYYCQSQNSVICGSQPNLLVRYSCPKIEKSSDSALVDFIKNDLPYVRNGRLWVGDATCFYNIKHLMPNHYLDLNTMSVKRYWPVETLKNIDLDKAVKLAASYLKGVLKAVTHRYDVMMAVTSGIDSRSLLAASKDVQNRIYYFINKHKHLNDDSADISIPKNILSELNLPFHIHNVEDLVDEEFKKIFLSNTFMAKELMLKAIYNVYYKNHQNKVNVLGVGEIGREYYGNPPLNLDGYYLAWCLKYKKSKYAVEQCDKWLKETLLLSKAYNVDIMQLFLWEYLLGNWGAVGNSESDIAIEEFDPYDSHYIYEIMLAVIKDRQDIFHNLFKELWPDLLDFPFNPPETKRDKIKDLLTRMGIYKIIKLLKYQYDRWKFFKMR